MKPLLALAALGAAILVAPADADARGVVRSRQVVRGHGHAQAQVVGNYCAPQLVAAQVVAAQVVAPQQFYFPAPQQVFLPQVANLYAQAQVVAQPQVVYQPAPQQLVALPQNVGYGAQAQVFGGRQVSRQKQVVRGNASAALVLPY